jgi:CcmD family protein
MIKIFKNIFMLALIVLSANAFAQDNQPEMATGLYQSGKIYVVVTILSIIFIGITCYLIMLDRKISKLEKEINEGKGK